MKIEIIDNEGNLITDFELETNPFKVGETINISVHNYDKDFWTADEVFGEYKIVHIEHYFKKDYQRNKKIYDLFCLSVEVTKIL
jgi:hypothetical protein